MQKKKTGTPDAQSHEANVEAFFAQLKPTGATPIDPVEIKKRNASKSVVFAMRYSQK